MTRDIWAEINAQPLKAPPAWVRGPSGGEPAERVEYITERTRRLRSEPPCPSCGNKSLWRCDCETGEDA